MVVSGKNKGPQKKLFIRRNKFKVRDQFKYLGTLLSSDGQNKTEISSRIAQKMISAERNRY